MFQSITTVSFARNGQGWGFTEGQGWGFTQGQGWGFTPGHG